jgi:hypothetical protein
LGAVTQLPPALYDTTTLRNFGAIDRLDLCAVFHEDRPEPCWCEAVKEELGEPASPQTEELSDIVALQIAIGGDRQHNAGEAETIYFAEKVGGGVITDDATAYYFVSSRPALGSAMAMDTVRILTDLVTAERLASEEAVRICEAMKAAGRKLRKGHPVLTAAYFEVVTPKPLVD